MRITIDELLRIIDNRMASDEESLARLYEEVEDPEMDKIYERGRQETYAELAAWFDE
jgi:hypothetical protein